MLSPLLQSIANAPLRFFPHCHRLYDKLFDESGTHKYGDDYALTKYVSELAKLHPETTARRFGLDNVLSCCCIARDTTTFKLVFQKTQPSAELIRYENNLLLECACSYECTEIVNFMKQQCNLTLEDICCDEGRILRRICSLDSLQALIIAVETFDIPFEALIKDGITSGVFFKACAQDKTTTIKWIIEKYDLSLENFRNQNFEYELIMAITCGKAFNVLSLCEEKLHLETSISFDYRGSMFGISWELGHLDFIKRMVEMYHPGVIMISHDVCPFMADNKFPEINEWVEKNFIITNHERFWYLVARQE